MEFLCPRCGRSHSSEAEMKECIKRGQERIVPVIKKEEESETIRRPIKINKPNLEPKPIKLEYKYTGDCKDCGNPITTLIIDKPKSKSKQLAIAFCTRCNKQHVVKEVATL